MGYEFLLFGFIPVGLRFAGIPGRDPRRQMRAWCRWAFRVRVRPKW